MCQVRAWVPAALMRSVRRRMRILLRRALILVSPFLVTPCYAQLLNPSDRPSPLVPYTNCPLSNGLASVSVERAPHLPMARPVETPSGTRRVSVADGYRVILAFPNTDPFVNLKIEVSVAGHYAEDKRVVLEEMQAYAADDVKLHVQLERSERSGVDIAAVNRAVIESGVLSIYSLFDDKESMIVTAYVLNQLPTRRAFQDMDSYKKLRDTFVGDYIQCMAAIRRE